MSRCTPALALLASCLASCLAAGCLVNPAEERAMLDLQVGRGEAGGVEVRVEKGLASIQALSAGKLALWAQAPALRVRLRTSATAAQRWRLTVDNVMPGAVVAASTDVGQVTATPAAAGNGQPRRWDLQLPRGAEVTLSIAPPDAATTGRFRFAVLNDIHVKPEDVPTIRAIFARIAQDPEVRFLLSCGDLTWDGEREQLQRVKDQLDSLGVPLFTTIGNHEQGAGDPRIWHELFGRHSTHFAFRGARFTLVDSASATLDPLVQEWLDEWLAASRSRVHLFATHMPLLDPVGVRNGAFRSRKEAGKHLARLARERVDLLLFGHLHSYFAFSLAGIPAHVTALGGSMAERLDGIEAHYLAVDVDPAAGRVERVSLVRLP